MSQYSLFQKKNRLNYSSTEAPSSETETTLVTTTLSTEPDQASPLAEEDVSLVEREGQSDSVVVNDTEIEG